MPTALAVEPHSSFLFLLLLYLPYTVPDVTSSSILSMTFAASLSPMTSIAATVWCIDSITLPENRYGYCHLQVNKR